MVRICKNNRYHSIQTTITWIFESNERIWIGDIFSFWWSLGCAASRRLGTFMDFSQSFHNLRCLHFALHQKDISGSSRSPEVLPRCILRRSKAGWRWWSCSSRRKLPWLWKTTEAGGLGWEMWWAFDGFCFLIWFYCITILIIVLYGGCFVCWTLRLPVFGRQSMGLRVLRHKGCLAEGDWRCGDTVRM